MRPRPFVLILAIGVLSGAMPSGAQNPGPPASPGNADWQIFVDTEHGTRVEYPAAIFSEEAGAPTIGTGRTFRTADDRAHLEIYSLSNRDRDIPATYVAKNFKFRRSGLDYDRVTPDFFALSGIHQDTVYYSRCNFPDGRNGPIHCVYLSYPYAETKAWDAIVTRISRSLRPLRSSRSWRQSMITRQPART
jgi:hypothetical protein